MGAIEAYLRAICEGVLREHHIGKLALVLLLAEPLDLYLESPDMAWFVCFFFVVCDRLLLSFFSLVYVLAVDESGGIGADQRIKESRKTKQPSK